METDGAWHSPGTQSRLMKEPVSKEAEGDTQGRLLASICTCTHMNIYIHTHLAPTNNSSGVGEKVQRLKSKIALA